jgi:alpha-galactosidase
MTQFQYKGKNAYPLIDEWIENEAEKYWKSEKYLKCLPWENEQMSPGAVDTYKILGLFPIGDTVRSMSPWWHHTNLETKKRWYGPTGGFDSEIGWSLLLDRLKNNLKKMDELARNPDLPLKREFPAVMSGEQHIPIIDAILNDKETLMQLNVPNEGAVSGIGDDVVVETPVLVSAKGIQRIQVGKLPNRLMQYAINVRMHRMEQLLQAYLEGDRESLVLMNTEDPRAKSYEQTKALLDDLLSQSWNAEAAEHYK